MKKIIELEFKNFFNVDIESPLRKISKTVEFDDLDLNQDLIDLKRNFNLYKISVGLAAPQIGINKRIIIVNLNKETNEDLIIINPKIVSNTGKTKKSFESCLSVPKYKGIVKRKDKLELEYQDIKGNHKTLKASGFLSRVILHEIDHLNGILFVDRMENQNDIEKVDFEWK